MIRLQIFLWIGTIFRSYTRIYCKNNRHFAGAFHFPYYNKHQTFWYFIQLGFDQYHRMAQVQVFTYLIPQLIYLAVQMFQFLPRYTSNLPSFAFYRSISSPSRCHKRESGFFFFLFLLICLISEICPPFFWATSFALEHLQRFVRG